MKRWNLRLCGMAICLIVVAFNSDCFAQNVSIKKQQDRTRILIDDELFTEVVHGNGTPYGEVSRPFLYPIYGPTGAVMTRSFPMDDSVEGEEHDHPHHRSFWFAHPVNGVDFWSEAKNAGRIVPTGDVVVNNEENGASLALTAKWISIEDKEILQSEQEYRFSVLDDGSRVIDVHIELTTGEDVERATFADTKEGSMALRSHPALRLEGEHATGHAINSEGDKDRELWGKRARWVAYYGEINEETCGFAIFDHPQNLRHPTWWHARQYGLVGANPFGIHDFEKLREKKGEYVLNQDESLTFQYRFVFFAGTAEQAKIEEQYQTWATSTNETR